jgi:hypothetical protein
MCLGTKELNRRLHNLPEAIRQNLKQRRRTLKNRNYAQNCRSRKITQQGQVEKENIILKRENAELKEKVQKYESTLKNSVLLKEIVRLRYLLQQSKNKE